jgi:hypothetical protein
MEKTQNQKVVEMMADALIYAETTNLNLEHSEQNHKVIANVLSVIIKKIKDMDNAFVNSDPVQRQLYIDLFWHIAEKNKMMKNV